MTIQHVRTTPILRSFNEAAARAFYVDYLGFKVDWEHRFEPELPLFMQVSRAGIQLWLSEHHGDGSPGANVAIEVTGVREFHAELSTKPYGNARPGIEPFVGGGIELIVTDPAGNRLSFIEREPAAPTKPRIEAIAPFFIVRDVVAAAEFYRDKLGFTITLLIPPGDEFFAIVRRDGAELLLKAPDAEVGPLPNAARSALARWDAFINTVAPDELRRELTARGAAVHVPPENADDGLTGFEVRDLDGYVLFFGHPV